MSRHTLTGITCLAAWLVTLSSGAAAGSVNIVRFTLEEGGAVLVPVTVDGAGPFRFLLDTGSSRSAIAAELAEALGAPVVARSEVVTSTGRAFSPVVRLSRPALGNTSVDSLLALKLPADALGGGHVRVSGVLGQDFLGPHNYTLDYRRRTLTWGDGPVPDRVSDTRVPLVWREGRVLAELAQDDARIVRLVPDSGANALILFTRSGSSPLPIDRVAGRIELMAGTGRRDVLPVVVRTLKVGSITLRNQSAVAVERDEPDAPDGDGLLPLHEYRSVSFNSDGYIVFRR
jgi:predicted aspartyl protease